MKILITLGDPAGIGPEVVKLALERGDFAADVEFELLGGGDAVELGKPTRAGAERARAALECAAQKLRDGEGDAVVTAPIAKENLKAVGFDFPGQTEFFAERLGASHATMCLSGANLTVGLVTVHVALADVAKLLTRDAIVRAGRDLAAFAQQKTGTRMPRIAVCGLNPHAGENGLFGDEEQRVIQPAIEQLNALGIADFVGPAVPDAIFRDAARGDFAAVLAMYHDQGLIPLKLLDFDTAVNVSLGLPKPRTSPDHGTAFAIAGKNLASPNSMIRAIELAIAMVRNR